MCDLNEDFLWRINLNQKWETMMVNCLLSGFRGDAWRWRNNRKANLMKNDTP